MLKQIKLTSAVKTALKNDPRVQELYATWQERELNVLEAIMLHQIIAEATTR